MRETRSSFFWEDGSTVIVERALKLGDDCPMSATFESSSAIAEAD